MADAPYHIGFGEDDLPDGTSIALLSGDPARSELIATKHLRDGSLLARNRGLDAFHARLPGGAPVVCATSGMGAPTMSVVVNELVQVGIRTVIRIGTSGSIRDDGPLKDVVTDIVAAQDEYADALEGAGVCLMLASALHAIAVGNLLPARVRTVIVDMTESVPVKLGNRGTMQAIGLVTDVGFFLERLETELRSNQTGSERSGNDER